MDTSTPTTTECRECRRTLRSAKSIANGIGPGCAAKIRRARAAADLADFKPAQIDKAMELIEQGGILRTSRPGIYTTVSGNGSTTYLVHLVTCTCTAGLKGRACYHRAAARILDAAAPAARRAA
ncbi:DUF6011 domain-containing protein [Sphaerisporangium aureirubrum]|uniref:DUF6011 domain-containing protein n=1 Tax=Sphaerisporangium aureirubrum TaxID=1544736 RepID=A0ABW1NCX4_9ACTN